MTANRNFKPVECNRGCGQQIYFDRQSDNGWSQTGKMVPLQWDEEKGPTDTGHQCPNSDYGQRKGSGGGAATTTTTTSAARRDINIPSGTEMILGNTLDILGKVERIQQRIEAYGQQLFAIQKDLDIIKTKLNVNPLDDDGDASSREDPQSEPAQV